MLIKINSI